MLPSHSLHSAALATASFTLLAGCAVFGGMPVPDGLAYGPPDPNPATYTFSDTAEFTVQTAMGPMTVVTSQSGTAELDFLRWDAGYQVQVRFPDFAGSFNNPAQGETRVDEAHIGGPFTVRVEHGGLVEVTDTPSLSDALLDIAGPESLMRPLFVHLPGRAAGPGARWVDTVSTAEEAAGTRSVVRSIVTSTLEGDTLMAGRRLLRIATTAESTVEVTGVSGGVEIEQRLSGTTAGTVLWDDRARLLVERWETGELTGTLVMVGVPVEPMAVQATLHRRVSLRK